LDHPPGGAVAPWSARRTRTQQRRRKTAAMGVYCSGIRDLRAPPCRRSAGGAGLAGAPGAAAPARGFCFGFGTLPRVLLKTRSQVQTMTQDLSQLSSM